VKIPELCSAYYTCTPTASAGQFQVSTQVCDPKFEFSTATGKCEPTALAGCSQTRAATTTTSTTVKGTIAGSRSSAVTAAATSAPNTIVSKEPTGDYPDYYEYPDPDPSATTRKPQKPVVICQNQNSGRMSDPASCRHYFRCGRTGPTRIQCPMRNLYYNEQLRMCWFRANCGNRQV
jgi:Chitin binding Peritrophin-A domain